MWFMTGFRCCAVKRKQGHQNTPQSRVGNIIKNALPVPPRGHQTIPPQHSQVLRNGGLPQPQKPHQLPNPMLPLEQLAEEHQPVRICNGLKYAGSFQSGLPGEAGFNIHTFIYIKIRMFVPAKKAAKYAAFFGLSGVAGTALMLRRRNGDYAASSERRSARFRSFGLRCFLRRRMALGVTSTSSSSST